MFSRQTIYSGEQPQSAILLTQERNTAKSIAQFVADAMGSTGAQFSGLTASPGTGLTVNLSAGSLYQLIQMDPTAWGSLTADTSTWLLQGLTTAVTNLTGFAAPATAGQSINYLIEAQLVQTDTATVSTPFYSSSGAPPTMISKSPSRQNVVTFQVKAGAAATTGSQVTPTADPGWVPMWQVTVDNGESSLTSADIALAPNAPQFSGFVHTNPNGSTPVYLSPASQQIGFINISGVATVGTITATNALLGGATATANFDGTFASGLAGDYALLTAVGFTGSAQVTDSLNIKGSIGYKGAHAGTDADPYPISQLNVAMLGGKLASDYALASGAYITLYTGAPAAGAGNAAITGYFQANVATGTAPIQVVSTTVCPNLNAALLGGFSAGNSTGNVPVSNGALNVNLNAQLLNGLASSAFQPAGNYAAMNTSNVGSFGATGNINVNGGTGSIQVEMNYAAANSFGLNAGGVLGYLQSTTAPLGLVGPSIRTNSDMHVGDGTPANVYLKDLFPSGIVRSGQCVYTVTYGGTANSYPYPGNGNFWGYYASTAGQINVGADTLLNSAFYIGYRCIVTLNASVSLTLAGIGLPTMQFYVDGVVRATLGSGVAGPMGATIGAGTHTIDIIYSAYDMGNAYYLGSEGSGSPWGGSKSLFGWMPFSGGQLSSAITSIVPG